MDRGAIDEFYREEFGRAVAGILRVVGDFDIAEESVQEAFAAALEQWPRQGWPASPRAWIHSTARHKAIDVARRLGRFERIKQEILAVSRTPAESSAITEEELIRDERLRLVFTCCHPALAPEAQVAISLRTLCGLSTEEIARAFLVPVATMAQRLVRAKKKIREAGIPYEVPAPEQLTERLGTVMAVIYLVFNEGYVASGGNALVRTDLCAEAIRLGRMLVEQIPGESEPRGLLALMLLHDGRRAARIDADGELVLLEDQDRSLWNRRQIDDGLALVGDLLENANPGTYLLQAAIAAEHARAERAEETDWRRICELYAALAHAHPTPVVELNRAVAVAMAEGPQAGLTLLDRIRSAGELDSYYPLWAALADLSRRLGRTEESVGYYKRALTLVATAPERRFIRRRLEELGS